MHYISTYSARKEFVLLDNTNPKALCNVLPEAFVTLVRRLYDSDDGFLLALAESQLRSELRRRDKLPTAQDTLFRYRFWCEYHAMLEQEVDIVFRMGYVIQSDMSKEAFYKFYLTQPEKLAWIISQPQDYRAQVREALLKSGDRLLGVLDYSFKNNDGSLNGSAVRSLLKVYEKLSRLYKEIASDEREFKEEKPKVARKVKEVEAPNPRDTDGIEEEDFKQKIEALRRRAQDG